MISSLLPPGKIPECENGGNYSHQRIANNEDAKEEVDGARL